MHARKVLRAGFLAGVGAALHTKEMLWGLTGDLIKQGEARHGEVEASVARWVQRGEQEHEAVRERVKDKLDHTFFAANLATKEDITALSERIERLAEQLGK